MKNPIYLIMSFIFFFLFSCDKEDPAPIDYIANISFLESSPVNEEQEIKVTIQKNTPCQYFSRTDKTISGNTFNYNFIYKGEDHRCITIYGVQEIVPVVFNPSVSGEYTLNFLINGKLSETKTITVTE